MSQAPEANRDNAPLGKKIEDLYDLIEGIEIAMFTTRRPGRPPGLPADGHPDPGRGHRSLVRHRHRVEQAGRAGLRPKVNLAYYKDGTREWVSVSGTAMVSQDRVAIHELYRPDWKVWFGDEGGQRDGGPDDPRLALILVDVHSVSYMKVDKPKPLVLFEVVKGMVTGTPPERREAAGVERGGGKGAGARGSVGMRSPDDATRTDFDAIRETVEELHECEATYLSTQHVRESLDGTTVWDGAVSIFAVSGHPAANTCYAWSAEESGSAKRFYYAVLHYAPIESARDAVRTSFALKQRPTG